MIGAAFVAAREEQVRGLALEGEVADLVDDQKAVAPVASAPKALRCWDCSSPSIHCGAVGTRRGARALAGLIARAMARRLLCLSRAVSDDSRARRARSCDRVRAGGLEQAEEVAGDVALEAAFDFARRLAFGRAPGRVGACGGVVLQAGEDDGVQRAVEVAVAGAVEPVADGLAGRGWDWRRAASIANGASLRSRLRCDQEQ
jgi:hypothetical protein